MENEKKLITDKNELLELLAKESISPEAFELDYDIEEGLFADKEVAMALVKLDPLYVQAIEPDFLEDEYFNSIALENGCYRVLPKRMKEDKKVFSRMLDILETRDYESPLRKRVYKDLIHPRVPREYIHKDIANDESLIFRYLVQIPAVFPAIPKKYHTPEFVKKVCKKQPAISYKRMLLDLSKDKCNF